ncbi:MAG TPA: pyridoxal phosphate-dependent aminotransferase [Candidatus Aenigmarchaeota archaeon]|nr:pyridoxal phosphate-dependent aminotransferase [Candidatus Aenigmarchaeota archaeon]
MRNIISDREEELPVSTMGKLLQICAERKDVISLGPGEPDFDSPKNIIRFAKKKLDEGYTHYSPPGGRRELKELIVRKLRRENKISASLENIVVVTGSTEGILLALMCLVDPGEGVIITDPGFLAYKPTVEILNGMPILVPLYEEEGFQFNVDRAREMIIQERTKAMIINTPLNPTGTVLKRNTLEEIADFAVENELIIISDEAYEKFVYSGNRHVSIASLNGMEERVVSLFSFSKSYAMPGFRIGYAVGPEQIIGAMTKLHLFSTICAPTVSQLAAIEALRGPQASVRKMLREYDRRRRFIYKRINEIPGFSCLEPQGAFYAFPNIKNLGMKSYRFAEWLLNEARVAVVPGTEFGKHGEGYVRLSYATAYEKIEKAMDRIEKAVRGRLRR